MAATLKNNNRNRKNDFLELKGKENAKEITEFSRSCGYGYVLEKDKTQSWLYIFLKNDKTQQYFVNYTKLLPYSFFLS